MHDRFKCTLCVSLGHKTVDNRALGGAEAPPNILETFKKKQNLDVKYNYRYMYIYVCIIMCMKDELYMYYLHVHVHVIDF